ncbi:MAG TPA: diaminopimelate decarboxylase [Streptosporangiaceae bacterium]|nr:diaminopimelate decarboxylase [Streptosporangiaceae bacterium]
MAAPTRHGREFSEGAHEVRVGGCDLARLAAEYGTPLYAYDEDGLRDTCRQFLSAFRAQWPQAEVAYACKAFAVGAMIRLALSEGLRLDVASAGELDLATSAGAAGDAITFHGCYKTVADLEAAVRAQVGHVVIDSLGEIDDLIAVTTRLNRTQPVLIRINPEVDVRTDTRYRVGGADSKFGLPVGDESARRAAERVLASPWLRLDGVHFHLGSQIMTAEPYLEAIERTARFVADLRSRHSWAPRRVILGGGMGVGYDPGQVVPTPRQWAAVLGGAFRDRLAPLCAAQPVLGIEPGRAAVADHGVIAYTAGVVKRQAGRPGRTLVVVDGGLSDNPRPLMYSARHQVRNVSAGVRAAVQARPAADAVTADIYGRHCETDLLFSDVVLPDIRRGDVLAVLTAGAYTHCMASNYNRFYRPAVVFAADGASRLVVRRETSKDLLRCEQQPSLGAVREVAV